jgi:hypothetical protein
MMKRTISIFLSFTILSLLVLSCKSGQSDILEREELFSLRFGRMEDDIDLVEHYGIPSTEKTRILMRNGLFYVANGNSGKVMVFNSYGDILSLYYNSATNPPPVMLATDSDSDAVSSRKAFSYPFTQIGEIALTGTGELLVEERAQDYQISVDEELGTRLNTIVLRFRENGEVSDYLGQEGVGGTPFSYVEALFTASDDAIVVVTRGTERWPVFWFDKDGDLLSRTDIDPSGIPVPENGAGFAVPSIKSIFPDKNSRELYVVADYYRSNEGTGAVDFYQSAITVFDTDLQEWVDRIVLPAKRVGNDSSGMMDEPSFFSIYEALGVTRDGSFFFLAPEEGNDFELMIMRRDASVINRSRILIEDNEVMYRDFDLSPDGVLSALFAYEYEAKIVWWRSDRLLGR